MAKSSDQPLSHVDSEKRPNFPILYSSKSSKNTTRQQLSIMPYSSPQLTTTEKNLTGLPNPPQKHLLQLRLGDRVESLGSPQQPAQRDSVATARRRRPQGRWRDEVLSDRPIDA